MIKNRYLFYKEYFSFQIKTVIYNLFNDAKVLFKKGLLSGIKIINYNL
jgi:hypothetical protein